MTEAHVADAWVWPFVWQGNVSIFTAIFKVHYILHYIRITYCIT